VPAHGKASVTLPNAVCLSTAATNEDAGDTYTVSGSVPFKFADETEYAG